MKLHVFDHCPFCVRVRMCFGLKGIPCELEFHLDDDEEAPIRMIGRNMLPILEDEDGFMGESLDIVRKVDGLSGERLFDAPPRLEIDAWIGRWATPISGLAIPRTADPIFPEFRTEAARAYFTRNKEAQFGAFAGLLSRTDAFKAELAPGLAELALILPDAEGATMDDIVLFPLLRSLSIVPELPLPAKVSTYCERMAERSGVPLVSQLRRTTA